MGIPGNRRMNAQKIFTLLSFVLCSVAFSAPPAPQNVQQAWLGSESLLLWDAGGANGDWTDVARVMAGM